MALSCFQSGAFARVGSTQPGFDQVKNTTPLRAQQPHVVLAPRRRDLA